MRNLLVTFELLNWCYWRIWCDFDRASSL